MLETMAKKHACLSWVSRKISAFVDFVCSFLEMHLVKIVYFSVMALCCYVVNALHVVIVFIMLLCLLFGTAAMRLSFSFIGPFIGILFLSKMAYQTKFVPKMEKTVNCSTVNATLNVVIENTILDPKWWGFETLGPEVLISYYKGYVIIFVVLTFQAVIRARQKIARIDAGELPEVPYVLFLKITRKNADKNLKNCIKYLINYGFYKFGIEITLTYCVFIIVYRMDIFSVIYAIWVFILFLPKRTTLAVLWPFFLTTLIFSVLWQYNMAVGLSKNSCFKYPWEHKDPLVLWMYLPTFEKRPDTKKTLADFVLLLLIQRQLMVFELERKYGDKYLGGSNKEEYKNFYDMDFVNPTPDHTGNIKSWIDVVKFLFMSCLFRVTLAFLFWNGASNVNFLSLGYLVGAFVFLWIDYDLCLWPVEKILKWWNILLTYIVCVILIKTLLEFAGCVYGDFFHENWYWSVELLSIHCSSSKQSSNNVGNSFYWDAVCFALVIFQRRYFKSYYFQHEMDDALGVFRLQAKGAKLMDELQNRKLQEFQEHEAKTLLKIKKNMNRIKAWQKRMQGLNYNEPMDHATAIYMGDYFMFEDLEELSTKVDESSSSSEDEYDASGNKKEKSLTMTEFIGTVFKRTGDEPPVQPKKKAETVTPAGKKPEPAEKTEKPKKKIILEDQEKDKKEKKKTEKSAVALVSSQLDNQIKDSKSKKSKKDGKLYISFLNSVMVSLVRFFKRYSKDYIYIQSMMKEERKKHKFRIRKGSRERSDYVIRGEIIPTKSSTMDSKRLSIKSGDSRDDDVDRPKSSQTLLVNLINAVCMFIMSKTELLCYIIIFLHTVLSPTLISLPLPLLVFLWGSLTSTRPTTTFWTVLIAYTEVTVVIKAVFQNLIFPWNNPEKKHSIRPDYPPLFLGIYRDNQYVIADLFLLLLLFLHRYKLKTLGLWNRTHEEENIPPQNLKVYRELPSENKLKTLRGNRSLISQRKKFLNEPLSRQESVLPYSQMSTYKCTSRATARIIPIGSKFKTFTRIKEIEGTILVTHQGRRLQPTDMHVAQMADEELEGNIVLRVYVNDVIPETKTLFYRLSWIQHFTSLRKFFIQIVVRDWGVSADFYTLMFIFEFFDFLIVFFGYSSFTDPIDIKSDDYFSLIKNQVPPMYLFTMIAHFLVIIIDRIFYLRKNVIGKLILQIILVIMVHIWMFIVIPIVTESSFNRLHVPQTYYMISCFYFLMSAYQLRVGYPMRVQGHFLCKKYNYVNYYAYKGLQFIPFFNQLRILLDYLCIHSSLTLMEWVRMESIFQLVYENKCSRRADIHYPSARGEECPKPSKYAPSILAFLALIIVIWLPFLLFALFNTVAVPNLPQEAHLEVHVGTFGRIYLTKATFSDIIAFTESQYKTLQNLYKNNKKIWTFLSMYDNRDVGVLKFRFEPYSPWLITSQELMLLNETIQSLDTPITLYVTWEVQRIPRSQLISNAKGKLKVVLKKDDEARLQLAEAFLKKGTKVRLNNVLPKFIHITNEGAANPVSGFLRSHNRTNPYRNVTLNLEEDNSSMWWKMNELADDTGEDKLDKIPLESKKEITIFSFNEKNIPQLFYTISKKGIIGLYLSIVFVLWTFVKRIMWKYPQIMFEDMPNPDPVLKLCQDIYLARESHDFALEEDLFAKLLFLFRSPETMIKVTRLNP